MNRCTMMRVTGHAKPHDSNQRVSGIPGAVQTSEGPVDRETFEEGYIKDFGGKPSVRRFAILSRMLELEDGDIVVVPNMPVWRKQFTIARVSRGYEFGTENELDDHRHIVHVHPESVRIFGYSANEDAYLISGLFSRAAHWPAISFCYNTEQIKAALRLLERPNDPTSKPFEEFYSAAIGDAFKAAATALRDQVKNWNGKRFQDAVWQAFKDQGYTMHKYSSYDGQGGDADILVSPPASPYGVFLPGKIAVQVKWKKGVDKYDKAAVWQIVQWAKSQESDAAKYVISSASSFTKDAQQIAADEDVMLIGGLQTMCFLLGVADRYREEWDPME